MTTFAQFAEVADRLGQTRKRLDKAALLAAFWAPLDDTDLCLAARYFSGRVFALWDQRVLNLGHGALLKVLEALSAQPAAVLKQRLVQLGDLGDLACEVLPAAGAAQWTLQQLDQAWSALVSAAKPAQRAAALHTLLAGASPVEAKYLVKLVLGDLRIGLKEGTVEEAIARAHQIPLEAVQWANMLLGDPGETAVRARAGTLGSVAMRLFHPLKFMLATPAADTATVRKQFPGDFAMEDKYDGIRAQAHVSAAPAPPGAHGVQHGGAHVALFSRTLDDITASFPELLAPLAGLAAHGQSWVLDGEILAMQGATALPFAALQTRLGRKTPSAAVLAETPVALMLFDVLVHRDQVLLETPFAARRRILQQLPVDGLRLHIAPSAWVHDTEALDSAFALARARGNEGLMLKGPESLYKPGRRGRDWLKIKRPQANLDVVITAAEVGHGKRHTVLSDYTFALRRSATDATLLDIGKAYSGLTDAEIAALSEVLHAQTHTVLNHGKKRLVHPTVVLEITFDLAQKSTRYASGYALRFPRIVRWRTDKPVSEIDTLDTLDTLVNACKGPEQQA